MCPIFPVQIREQFSYQAMRIQLYSRLATKSIGRSRQLRSYTTSITVEPLRVLFCGSDEFSAASLQALHKEQQRDKALIESIDVVCRPAKRVGRGLQETREGDFSLAPLSLHLLKSDQYPSPGLQKNWHCLYMRLIRLPSGRLVFYFKVP